MKAKAVIIYLSRSTNDDLQDLRRSLELLDRHFNDRFGYPVLIFHEDFTQSLMQQMRDWTRSELRFAQVDFSLPEFIDAAQVPPKILGRFSIGYRHMCRFFAGLIYHHPALGEFDWYWRLDTDSFILQQVRYDPFAAMENENKDYGYIALLKEKESVVQGLWQATRTYAQVTGLPLERLVPLEDGRGRWNLDYYYNNFEICRLSFGRSEAYQAYFRHLDRLGGIYFYRWGDAPIRTLAVALLIPNRTRCFRDIGYAHAGYYSKFYLKIRERLIPRLKALLGMNDIG